MTWYSFQQNNSGGRFLIDETVDIYVVVEETTIKKAIKRARSITKKHREFCHCCGVRWSFDEDDIEVHDYIPTYLGDSGILYDLDGSITKLPGRKCNRRNGDRHITSLLQRCEAVLPGSTDFVFSDFFSNLDVSRLSKPIELPPLISFSEFYNAISQED